MRVFSQEVFLLLLPVLFSSKQSSKNFIQQRCFPSGSDIFHPEVLFFPEFIFLSAGTFFPAASFIRSAFFIRQHRFCPAVQIPSSSAVFIRSCRFHPAALFPSIFLFRPSFFIQLTTFCQFHPILSFLIFFPSLFFLSFVLK